MDRVANQMVQGNVLDGAHVTIDLDAQGNYTCLVSNIAEPTPTLNASQTVATTSADTSNTQEVETATPESSSTSAQNAQNTSSDGEDFASGAFDDLNSVDDL